MKLRPPIGHFKGMYQTSTILPPDSQIFNDLIYLTWANKIKILGISKNSSILTLCEL